MKEMLCGLGGLRGRQEAQQAEQAKRLPTCMCSHAGCGSSGSDGGRSVDQRWGISRAHRRSRLIDCSERSGYLWGRAAIWRAWVALGQLVGCWVPPRERRSSAVAMHVPPVCQVQRVCLWRQVWASQLSCEGSRELWAGRGQGVGSSVRANRSSL